MRNAKRGFPAQLRKELLQLAESYVAIHSLEPNVYRSRGKSPTTLFKSFSSKGIRHHGNFLDESYSAVLANENWKLRLKKPHSQRRALNIGDQSEAKELDSCCSSDALLMNIFCHTSSIENAKLASLFSFSPLPEPEFGFRANLLFTNGPREPRSSEIDMRLCDSASGKTLLVESKLTEIDFTEAQKQHVEGYFDFKQVFDSKMLPVRAGKYQNYQLIRNILAAHHLTASFCLICDERRPDLCKAFHDTVNAVVPRNLREGCRMVTWQRIADTLPAELQNFLLCKYGIKSTAK